MDILPERGSQQATKEVNFGLLIAAEGGGGKQELPAKEIVGVGVAHIKTFTEHH